MDKTNEKHFGLRVDGDILAKFRYVCGFEGRSANAQIIQLRIVPCPPKEGTVGDF